MITEMAVKYFVRPRRGSMGARPLLGTAMGRRAFRLLEDSQQFKGIGLRSIGVPSFYIFGAADIR